MNPKGGTEIQLEELTRKGRDYPNIIGIKFPSLQKMVKWKSFSDPFAWNTYYLWNDKIKYKHFQHHLDASITQGKYGDVIKKGIKQGIDNSYQFFKDREDLLTNGA